MVKPIPDGYHSVTPYLVIDGAAKALEFYQKALGAQELFRMPTGNKIGHAEIRIGDSHVMLSDEWAPMNLLSPAKRGGTTVSLMVYVEDVDAAYKRAIDAGASQERAPENQFYGDRSGSLLDPFGHRWTLATHVEDVPMDELQRRMDEFAKAQSEPA